ncbi:MAG: response regulator [Chloroflexota bacterium]
MAKILIVDDDAMTVDMLSMALKLFGHDVLRAYKGEEALAQVASNKPDAVLLDLMMPGLDGFEILKRLKALPEARTVPVLVVTASAEVDVEERVTMAGGAGCLHKPIDLDVLEREIQRVLAVVSALTVNAP